MCYLTKSILISLFFLWGCSDETFIESPPRSCEFTEDCSDYVHCTFDTCRDNICDNWEDDTRCSRYHYCDTIYGCRPLENPPPVECQTSEDCFDNISCTYNFCTGGSCFKILDDHLCPINYLCHETRDCLYSEMLGANRPR